jgi:3'-phosphoadenosine 5'-phosphosulfate sulfotransferase (PAPS reductase)/FAD synthetase
MPDIENLPLVVSTSGGETSEEMAIILNKKWHGKRQIINIFANTSREGEGCLNFLHRSEIENGIKRVWVEGVYSPIPGVGVKHRVVNYETACRDGSVFEEMIKCYGIPNRAFPHCTRDLKTGPIESYLRSIGIKKYVTAIGYRIDETGRINWEYARKSLQYYPLVETWQMRKADIRAAWSKREFRLQVQNPDGSIRPMYDYEGNCRNCWKKSINKILTQIADEEPNDPLGIDWNIRMEEKYSMLEFPSRNNEENPPPHYFFKDNLSARELKEMAKEPFKRHVDTSDIQGMLFTNEFDVEDAGCGSSCEPFGIIKVAA